MVWKLEEYSPSMGFHDDGNVKGSRELVEKCPQRLYLVITRITLFIGRVVIVTCFVGTLLIRFLFDVVDVGAGESPKPRLINYSVGCTVHEYGGCVKGFPVYWRQMWRETSVYVCGCRPE